MFNSIEPSREGRIPESVKKILDLPEPEGAFKNKISPSYNLKLINLFRLPELTLTRKLLTASNSLCDFFNCLAFDPDSEVHKFKYGRIAELLNEIRNFSISTSRDWFELIKKNDLAVVWTADSSLNIIKRTEIRDPIIKSEPKLLSDDINKVRASVINNEASEANLGSDV